MRKLLVLIINLIFIVLITGCFNANKQIDIAQEPSKVTKKIQMINPEGIPVLMYHKIGDEKDNDAVIRADLFKEQMQYLKDNGYNTLSMEELYNYIKNGALVPEKPVVITFDDGYQDTYTIAWPILKDLGFKATLFINPGDIGNRLTWQQIKSMHSEGLEIASHGFIHDDMNMLSFEQQANNIKNAQESLKRNLGIDNIWFCYPYGEYNENTIKLLKEHNIKMAMAMRSGWAHKSDDVYQIKRVWVGNSIDIPAFAKRLNNPNFE